MKRQWIIYAVIILFSSFVQEGSFNKELKNRSFSQGEKLKYRLHYGWFTAGEATVSVLPDIHVVNEKPCFKMEIKGKSKGAFASMFKVKDLWRSYVDTSTMIPQKFYRNIKEGRYRLNETTFYHHDEGRVHLTYTKRSKTVRNKDFEVPKNVHDIVSAFYYLRNIDYSEMEKGEKVKIDVFLEDENYEYFVQYEGKEVIKTNLGKVNAFKVVPVMPDNDIFDGEDSIVMWLSDDENKIPLKVRAKMFVGAVEMEITEESSLRHPLNMAK